MSTVTVGSDPELLAHMRRTRPELMIFATAALEVPCHECSRRTLVDVPPRFPVVCLWCVFKDKPDLLRVLNAALEEARRCHSH